MSCPSEVPARHDVDCQCYAGFNQHCLHLSLSGGVDYAHARHAVEGQVVPDQKRDSGIVLPELAEAVELWRSFCTVVSK